MLVAFEGGKRPCGVRSIRGIGLAAIDPFEQIDARLDDPVAEAFVASAGGQHRQAPQEDPCALRVRLGGDGIEHGRENDRAHRAGGGRQDLQGKVRIVPAGPDQPLDQERSDLASSLVIESGGGQGEDARHIEIRVAALIGRRFIGAVVDFDELGDQFAILDQLRGQRRARQTTERRRAVRSN